MLQWLGKMKPKVSPTTYRGYKYNIERGICPYFRQKNISLRNLRPIDLEQYYAYLQNQGLSANTAIHHHANIHKALKDAVRLDLVSRNVADLAERPVKVNYTPNHYSADEANELLQNRTPLIEVQQWLGHSTLETTANLSAHLEYETKLNSAGTLKKI